MSDCGFGKVPKDFAVKNLNVGCDKNSSITAERIVVTNLFSTNPPINPTQGPNAIAVGCGLVGNGTPVVNPVELERTVAMGNGVAPLSEPGDGFLRDKIIAEDPCNPRRTNFFLEVPHSADGHGIQMGFNNTLPNDGMVRGSAILGGEDNSIASGTVFTVIAGGQTNFSSSSYDFLGGGQNNTSTGDHCVITGGLQNTITTSTRSTVCGGGQNTITNGVSACIVCGTNNSCSSIFSFVGAGNTNNVQGDASGIVAGQNNTVTNGNSLIGAGRGNTCTSSDGGIYVGLNNVANGDYAFVGGGELNLANNGWSFIGSGQNNEASGEFSMVGSGRRNMQRGMSSSIVGGEDNLITVGGELCLIGGGQSNSIAQGTRLCTITGGLSNRIVNDCFFSLVAGGQNNTIEQNASSSVIVAGENNILSVGNSGFAPNASFIGAGQSNVIASTGNSFVAAGLLNRIEQAERSFIGGGQNNTIGVNTALGSDNSIVGGELNTITHGILNFIAGGDSNNVTMIGGANAPRNCSIVGGTSNVIQSTGSGVSQCTILNGSNNVISDCNQSLVGGSNLTVSGVDNVFALNLFNVAPVGSNAFAGGSNQFWMNTDGGTIFTDNNSGGGVGVGLASGANAWAVVSDRNKKENLVELQGGMLDKLNSVPLYNYNFIGQPQKVNVGAMAQDWNDIFREYGQAGEELRIHQGDQIGILLQCVKELYQEVQQLKSQK